MTISEYGMDTTNLFELALFAGAGGGILGGHMLGFRCIGAVEFAEYPRRTLIQRQDDGCLPPFPVWDDIRTFTKRNRQCRPYMRALRKASHRLVVSGGFPCQDISAAGKGAGIEGERSGLWGEMWRVVCELRPRFAFVENSPMLTSRGLGRVLGDLASIGYDAEWTVLGADDVGAPHRRDRIWILAHSDGAGGYIKPWIPAESRQEIPNAHGCRRSNSEPVAHAGHGMHPERSRETRRQGGERTPERSIAGDDGEDVADAAGQRGATCRPQDVQPHRADRAGGSGECDTFPNALRDGCQADHRGQSLSDVNGHSATHEAGREEQQPGAGGNGEVANALRDGSEAGIPGSKQRESRDAGKPFDSSPRREGAGCWWKSEPHLGGVADGLASGLDIHGSHAAGNVGRVATGIPNRVSRLTAIGNGQVPACAATAFVTLLNRFNA